MLLSFSDGRYHLFCFRYDTDTFKASIDNTDFNNDTSKLNF